MPLVLHAPAKVNLCLRVLGRRPDGYHEIDSLFFQVSLFDTLTFEPSDGIRFASSGMDAGPDEDNLVARAARLLNQRAGTCHGATISLEKRIPAGAGLGGGSSDAATALLGLNAFWGLGFGADDLHDMALQLGSDVPFFLSGPAARVGGRGEIIENFTPDWPFDLLLVKPACHVSTEWAYRAISLTKGGRKYRLPCSATGKSSMAAMAGALWNDFEEPVFAEFPEISSLKARMLEAGAAGAVMSGSGSAVAGLFPGEDEARRAESAFPDMWRAVVKTLVGPPLRSDISGITGKYPVP